MLFSLSLTTLFFLSGPAITRSMDSAISSYVIFFLSRLAAKIADSLSKFMRSAPLKPAVCLAIASMSVSSEIGLPFE